MRAPQQVPAPKITLDIEEGKCDFLFHSITQEINHMSDGIESTLKEEMQNGIGKLKKELHTLSKWSY